MTSAADQTRTTPTIEKKPFWTKRVMNSRSDGYFLSAMLPLIALMFFFAFGLQIDGGSCETPEEATRVYNDRLRSQLLDYQTCFNHTGDRTACWIAVYGPKKSGRQ